MSIYLHPLMIFILYVFTICIGVGLITYQIFWVIRTKVPFVRVPSKHLDRLFHELKELEFPPHSTVFEMGSGFGDFSFRAKRKWHHSIVKGVEISPLHIWYTRVKTDLMKQNIAFIQQDFFTINLAEANLIFAFLVPEVSNKLWNKIKKECQPGTLFILYGSPLQKIEAYQTIDATPNNPSSLKFRIYQV